MDSDPNRNVGCTDLSGKSDSVPATRETAAIPAVTRPGAGPSSAMVIRSWARGGREINIEPDVEFRPEIEFLPEVEILAETDEDGSGTIRSTTDIASQYKPEIVTSQKVTTSAPITTPQIHRTVIPHTGSLNLGTIQSAGRSVTSSDIPHAEASIPASFCYSDVLITDSGSRAYGSISDPVFASARGAPTLAEGGSVDVPPTPDGSSQFDDRTVPPTGFNVVYCENWSRWCCVQPAKYTISGCYCINGGRCW